MNNRVLLVNSNVEVQRSVAEALQEDGFETLRERAHRKAGGLNALRVASP